MVTKYKRQARHRETIGFHVQVAILAINEYLRTVLTLLSFVKVKVNLDLYSRLVVNWVNTSLRCSFMARVLKGSHSFNCTPRVHPLTE